MFIGWGGGSGDDVHLSNISVRMGNLLGQLIIMLLLFQVEK